MTSRRLLVLLAIAVPLLSACINDGASFQIEGKEHSISFLREQKWFWDPQVRLAVVATRMPECQRRHHLDPAPVKQAAVEVWRTGSTTFILKQADKLYLVETQTCEGFRKLGEPPPGGLGERMGAFTDEGGALRFVVQGGVAAGK